MLKFPIRTLVDADQKKRVNQWISFVIVLVLVPSVYFGYLLVKRENFTAKATQLISTVNITEDNYLLKNIIDPEKKTITLIYAGPPISVDQKTLIREKAREFSLIDADIKFQQGFSFDPIIRKNSETENLTAEINRLTLLLKDKEKQIDTLVHKNDLGKQLLSEIKVLYPQIKNCSYSQTILFNDSTAMAENIEIVVFKSPHARIDRVGQKKITGWLQKRLKSTRVKVFFES